MLFNSYEFIFFFLPTIILLHHFGRKFFGFRTSIAILVVGSFFFYAWWNPPYLAVFLFSIIINFFLGRHLSKDFDNFVAKKVVLTLGVVFNLALLGYYKYTNFFLDQVTTILDISPISLNILLPIGISFYTFQQIAFLIDSYKERTDYDFISYCLFVSFFPQLIAGPIVHHKEMMPQFSNPESDTSRAEHISIGIFFFTLGLFKKVIIADNLSAFVGPVFDAADAGETITFVEAWLATFAYSMQLYFDFSGYSDMAIGLARIFGIRLPFNFNSPYKSRSIVDFWRRWHMTLSRFLRDYLYIFSLGGNRKGSVMRYRNLILTMGIGGLWHGAGWGFLIWGLLHGSYLVINHFSSFVFDKSNAVKCLMPSYLAWAITLLAIFVAWVPFRATTFEGALGIWSSMLGMNTIGLPATPLGLLGIELAADSSWMQLFSGEDIIELQDWVYRGIPFIIASTIVALYAPNTQELAKIFKEKMDVIASSSLASSRWLAIAAALIFLISLSRLNSATEFMYFQF